MKRSTAFPEEARNFAAGLIIVAGAVAGPDRSRGRSEPRLAGEPDIPGRRGGGHCTGGRDGPGTLKLVDAYNSDDRGRQGVARIERDLADARAGNSAEAYEIARTNALALIDVYESEIRQNEQVVAALENRAEKTGDLSDENPSGC